MTPKQRAKIYRKAAEGIDSGKWIFCCEAINWSYDLGWILEDDFPELFLFKPNDNWTEHHAWWGASEGS